MVVRAIIAAVLCGSAAAGGTAPTTTSAPAPRAWGRSSAGLKASVSTVGEWVFQGPLRADFALRNAGQAPATLADGKKLFGWLLISQRGNTYYTERIFHVAGRKPPPLAAGKDMPLPPVDIGRLDAFSYSSGLKLLGGYPAHLVAGKPQPRAPAGKVSDLLRPGPASVKYMVYLDRGREGPLMVVSAVVKPAVQVGDFSRLPADAKGALLAELAERMRRDAWSAKQACSDAARIGAPAVETLSALATDPKAKEFARMWAATALARIGGPRAEQALIDLLGDPRASVRHVVAYHGIVAGGKKLEAAILARATGGSDPMVTAWSIMGYLKSRRTVPGKLLAAGIESPQWKARAAVVETIVGGNPNRTHLPILRRLVRDPHPPIRHKAADGLRYVGDKSYETIDALIAAAAMDGDGPARAVVGALCVLTGKEWAYPDAPAEAGAKVVRRWQDWWAAEKATYRKRPPPE